MTRAKASERSIEARMRSSLDFWKSWLPAILEAVPSRRHSEIRGAACRNRLAGRGFRRPARRLEDELAPRAPGRRAPEVADQPEELPIDDAERIFAELRHHQPIDRGQGRILGLVGAE